MTGSLYNMLLGSLGDTEDIRYREKLICQCQEAAEQARQYRRELQAHMDAYFADYGQCFDEALAGIRFPLQLVMLMVSFEALIKLLAR